MVANGEAPSDCVAAWRLGVRIPENRTDPEAKCNAAEILERATGICWSHTGRRVDGAIQMISNQGGEIAYLSINLTRLIIQPVGSIIDGPISEGSKIIAQRLPRQPRQNDYCSGADAVYLQCSMSYAEILPWLVLRAITTSSSWTHNT